MGRCNFTTYPSYQSKFEFFDCLKFRQDCLTFGHWVFYLVYYGCMSTGYRMIPNGRTTETGCISYNLHDVVECDYIKQMYLKQKLKT